MNFTNALWELMLGQSGRLPDGFSGSSTLVFGTGSGMMGLLIMALDWFAFLAIGRSFLGANYTNPLSIIRLLLLWGAGAGLGGFLGASASIIQITRAGCISVGIGWPFILPRLIKSFGGKGDRQD